MIWVPHFFETCAILLGGDQGYTTMITVPLQMNKWGRRILSPVLDVLEVRIVLFVFAL